MACVLGRRILACLVLCAFAGCSTTATISRTDGWDYEADILGSDANSLRVRDTYGREGRVSREEVAEIDHPGNVFIAIGLGLVAMGGLWIVGDLSSQSASNQSDWSGMGVALGIPLAVTGLSFAIPGWIRYRRSMRAAKAFEDANPILPVPQPAMLAPYPYAYPAPYPYPPPPPPL